MNIRYDLVCCFVIRPAAADSSEKHELLQLRRNASDYMGGTWQPISGTIETGETASQAALRELAEESGLTPIEFFYFGVGAFYIVGIDTLYHRTAFAAIVGRDATVRLNDEHDAWRWVGFSTARQTFMWPDEWRLIDEMKAAILQPSLAREHLRIL